MERRTDAVRRTTLVGFGLYFVPVIGVCFIPRLAMLAPLAVALCTAAVLLAFNSLRCPGCGKKLGNLLLVKQEGRLFSLPRDLTNCPHCGLDLDSHGDHKGLPEILGGYDSKGEYLGIVAVPESGGTRRYELTLRGKAQEAFQDILQLHPFGKSGASDYHYFFAPEERRRKGDPSQSRMQIRVEHGEKEENVDVAAPRALVLILEWLYAARDPAQVVGLALAKNTSGVG